MADNSAAKNHLNTVETTLSDITRPDSINSMIGARSLDLYRNLTSENLFIDGDILANLIAVRDRLANLGTEATNRESYLNTQIAGLPRGAGGATARSNLMIEQSKVHQIATTPNRVARLTEYQELINRAQLFNLGTNLANIDMNVVTHAGRNTIPLTTVFGANPTRYALCDEAGNEITPTGGNYRLNIGGQEYTLGGINFTGGNLNCSALTITPALRNSPQEITLSINAIFDMPSVRNVNVVCNKKFNFRLNDGTILLNNTVRDTQFDNYNNALPVGHKISDTVETNFDTNRYSMERKALENILKRSGGTKYDTLNPSQKEEFYQRIRHLVVGGIMYFDNIYNAENINNPGDRYNEYKDWFVADGRDWNRGDNIRNNSNYITLIHNTVSERVQDFMINKLEHFMGDLPEEIRLKSELTRFVNEIEQNKLDNDNINRNIDTDVSHANHNMDRGPWSVLHNRDTNYMRFFSGSSTSIRGQKVDIHTNTDPESIDNPEPVKYDMDVNITGKNNISVEIKMDGTNEVIKHKSGEPSALIRKIMRDQRIKYGKARAHMGFNVYKAMVQMAKEKDISLQYRDGADHTRFIDIENGNIVVRQVDNLTTLRKEDGHIIFDQENFINMNEFDRANYNGALRQGLDNLGIHFNHAMNQLHRQYRHGVERRFLGIINSPSRMTLPTSARLSPIKKLLNLRNTTNFDFNTNIMSKGKNIAVDFKKNKFTINMEDLKKPITSRDLGKLLNHREKRVRVFDGVERDIVEGIYVALIDKLRQNANIARTDFGVRDEITGNMYVLDQDGEFGWIAREDLNNPLFDTPMTGLSEWRRNNKNFGMLNQTRLSRVTVHKMTDLEQKELMKNPFLMQRFVRAMNRRMGLWNTARAAFFK